MRFPLISTALALLSSTLFIGCAHAQGAAQPPDAAAQALLDKIGTWDGSSPSAKLEGPYETGAAIPQFGIIGYWNAPWRSYMDTWPATRLSNGFAVNWNIDPKYAEAMAQILDESGIHTVRYEFGWGLLGWDDKLLPSFEERTRIAFAAFKRHHIRPMILLNSHHGQPVPVRGVPVEVLVEAKKGDRVLKLKAGTQLRVGYVGLRDPRYIAAYPMVTQMDEDGTAHLSAALPNDIKAGPLPLIELKYQPFQGMTLKDGTPVPAAQETIDGWMKFLATAGNFARDAMGTPGQTDAQRQDAGFDIEIWNELTFGANFLDINNYYDEKRQYAAPMTYSKTRPWTPGMSPDAKTDFVETGYHTLLDRAVDYFTAKNGFPGVRVDDGFANQTPFPSSSDAWPGQAALSRHYYTGPQGVVSPLTPAGSDKQGGLDALGKFDGTSDSAVWWQVKPGTNFVPTFKDNFPEFLHSGFKTETTSRDLIPDSRLSGMPGHGRYTHNGDLHPLQVWQTEVEYDRPAFFNALAAQTGVKRDDPRVTDLDMHMAGKMLFRQYLFHIHKGFDRIYLFSLQPSTLNYGPIPQTLYDALDKSGDTITPAVRAAVPQHLKGMAWLTKQLAGNDNIDAPRPLRVDALTEYKPRLVFAGDGTAAHPSRYNRDQFAFLPFQQTARKFLIPYYVVTLNVEQAWDKSKDALDPERYDMPDQQFDVTIGNIAGTGATATAYDPLTNIAVPVKIVSATATTLTLRLQTVDYPRILQVEEAKPGVQISVPRIDYGKDGVRVSWKTNLPVDSARLTYGASWQTRSANDVAVATGSKTAFSVMLPANSDLVAARVRVTANGLSDVWPRWDEDPQGQVSLRQAVAVAGGGQMKPKASEDFTNKLGQYEADALPQNAHPAWGALFPMPASAALAANGALAIDTTADPAQKAAFMLSGFGLNDALGYTVEARVQVTEYTGGGTASDIGFIMQIFGDKQLMQVDFSDKQMAIRGGAMKDFNFADQMHTVRLIKHAGENLFDVYVDDKPLQINVPTVSAGADRITWGAPNAARHMKAKVEYVRADNTGAYLPAPSPVTVALTADVGAALPVAETNEAHGYSLKLPAGAAVSGDGDDRTWTFGGVTLRVRYLKGEAGDLDSYLPSTSVTDTVERTRVSLSGGAVGTLARYDLAAAAHPGMLNLAQRYLAFKRGPDLLLISVSGAPAAMQANSKLVRAIFAGVKLSGK